jgi:hypothetical protein
MSPLDPIIASTARTPRGQLQRKLTGISTPTLRTHLIRANTVRRFDLIARSIAARLFLTTAALSFVISLVAGVLLAEARHESEASASIRLALGDRRL